MAQGMTWIWVRRGKLQRETKSLLITAQNYSIRTNYIKAKSDNTQQNKNCQLCKDRQFREDN